MPRVDDTCHIESISVRVLRNAVMHCKLLLYSDDRCASGIIVLMPSNNKRIYVYIDIMIHIDRLYIYVQIGEWN